MIPFLSSPFLKATQDLHLPMKFIILKSMNSVVFLKRSILLIFCAGEKQGNFQPGSWITVHKKKKNKGASSHCSHCTCLRSRGNMTYFSNCEEGPWSLSTKQVPAPKYTLNTVFCTSSKSSNYEDWLEFLDKSGYHSLEEQPSIITPQRGGQSHLSNAAIGPLVGQATWDVFLHFSMLLFSLLWFVFLCGTQ